MREAGFTTLLEKPLGGNAFSQCFAFFVDSEFKSLNELLSLDNLGDSAFVELLEDTTDVWIRGIRVGEAALALLFSLL